MKGYKMTNQLNIRAFGIEPEFGIIGMTHYDVNDKIRQSPLAGKIKAKKDEIKRKKHANDAKNLAFFKWSFKHFIFIDKIFRYYINGQTNN